MKKVLFALAAVVALAACSKEQTLVTPQPDAIGFGQPFIENATRATDPTYGTTNKLTKFNVYGTVTGTAGTVNIYGISIIVPIWYSMLEFFSAFTCSAVSTTTSLTNFNSLTSPTSGIIISGIISNPSSSDTSIAA